MLRFPFWSHATQIRKSNFHVDDNVNINDLTSYKEDFDYHLPIGSMFTYILTKYSDKLKQDDFVLDWSFLKADPLRKNFWQSKLQAMSDKPKIGFVGEALSQTNKKS